MPSYNAVEVISSTIRSVLNQSYLGWELIVVDDCSNDGTTDVVDSFVKLDSRISLVKLERNFGGPAGPRNVGVALANYNLVAFLDADDIWHPRKLEIQVKLFREGNFDLVCSTVSDFYLESGIQYEDLVHTGAKQISYFSERFRNQIPTSSVIVRTTLSRRFPFNEARSYRAVEDYDSWLRMLESGAKCIKVKASLVMYRKIQGQISGSKWQMAKKVLMVHRNRSAVPSLASYLYTFTHLVGAFYSRVLLKKM
ncbi:glycosyltransferase family 2 protein [Marinobacterium sp. xm-d-564]|uniref:glycosyltransferase family 2 protein n=1 Tax=Marinobacterium sp. xm-d-564 TaxID=2497742 RepID=UPI0015694B2E|nr:glycosyltransferase family 2 protein [Marinobacterium sp. xm-d-564]